MAVALNQARYQDGDKLNINVDIPQPGYLNVVEVNAENQATVLFPNPYHADNRVQPGPFTLPTPQMQFEFTASAPFGHSTVFAFLTNAPVNLHRSNQLSQVFTTMPASELPELTRDFIATPTQAKIFAGKVETQICASQGGC